MRKPWAVFKNLNESLPSGAQGGSVRAALPSRYRRAVLPFSLPYLPIRHRQGFMRAVFIPLLRLFMFIGFPTEQM